MAPKIEGDKASLEQRSNEKISTMPGIWKYPTFRDSIYKSGPMWLLGRRKDEGVGDLWRVHDGLYDFSSWIHNHPGGTEWLQMTQGTDITEAFEAHHIFLAAEHLLPRFFVRKASAPRNSPYTYKEDGFYRTLKRRARELLKNEKSGPTSHSKIMTDLLLAGTLITAVLSGQFRSFNLGVVSGIFLALTTVGAHNFFHQKDNFRMYYFDLCLMSHRHWRISHAMSHHLFPNTLFDLEISLYEPFVEYMPKKNKTVLQRFGPCLLSPLIYVALCPVQFTTRMLLYAKQIEKGPQKNDFLPIILPSAIYFFGGCEIQQAVLLWLWITAVASFTFSFIALNAGHQHPETFHEGDKPREDMDWGKAQLDTVQDRPTITRSRFLSLVTFGNHILHHLFPTVDHGRLDLLMPLFLKSCEEFNIDFKRNSIGALIKGHYEQIANNKPNNTPPDAIKY